MISFVDEGGLNPLPPGMLVTIVDTNDNSLSGYTIAGGSVPGIAELPSTSYTASFYAQRAPQETQSFLTEPAGDTVVSVSGYRSPYLSTSGALALLTDVFPKDRANPLGAPNFTAIQSGTAAIASAISGNTQVIQGALRLQSSSGSAVDTWVQDFLGSILPRLSNESDTSYIRRALQWLMLPFGTIYGIQEIVSAWLNALQLTYLEAALAADTSGAADTAGALDGQQVTNPAAVVPKAIVFDEISNPTLFALLGLNALDAEFCVLFTFPNVAVLQNWGLDSSFLGNTTYLSTPEYYVLNACPAPALDVLIRQIKVAGTEPIYAANKPSS